MGDKAPESRDLTQNRIGLALGGQCTNDSRKDNQMQEQYTAPQLKLVGNASEVILGSLAVGDDLLSQILIPEMEFAED